MAEEIVRKTISELSEVTELDVNSGSEFLLAHSGSNYRMSLASLLKKVLGKVAGNLRTIGEDEVGSIFVLGGGQILDEQRLDEPKINSNTKVSATSEEINYACVGATGSVASQISAINDSLSELQNNVVQVEKKVDAGGRLEYIVSKLASASEESIKADEIISALDLGSRMINPRSIVAQYYKYDLGKDNLTGQNSSNILINIKSIGEPEVRCLDSIIFDTISSETYQYIITFRLIGE